MISLSIVHAQTSRLEFEVASVKRNISSGGSVFAGCHEPGNPRNPIAAGRCIFRRAPLTWIIAEAYGFHSFGADQWLKGEPGWVHNERYDIEAKAEDNKASPDDLKVMLRNLLADRFKLVLHETTKEVSGYAIAVAKGGPMLRTGDGTDNRGIGSNAGRMTANNVPIERLALFLSRELGAPVVDMTGLKKNYSFTLTFSGDNNDVSAPSIFTAIQEQLGLRLESRRVPTRILVIDHVERPSEN